MRKKKTGDEFLAEIALLNPNAIYVGGDMNGSIIGIDRKKNVLIYDLQKMLGVWVERDGMTRDEAIEWFYHNAEHIFRMGINAPKLRNQKL